MQGPGPLSLAHIVLVHFYALKDFTPAVTVTAHGRD